MFTLSGLVLFLLGIGVGWLCMSSYHKKRVSFPERLAKESKLGSLEIFQRWFAHLLEVSGGKEAEAIFIHFQGFCKSIEHILQAKERTQEESEAIILDLIRTFGESISSTILKMNKAHALKSKSKKILSNLRREATSCRSEIMSLNKRLAFSKKKQTKKVIETEIRAVAEKLENLIQSIRDQEKELISYEQALQVYVLALDQVICAMQHDLLTQGNAEKYLFSGIVSDSFLMRKRIKDELDLLLDVSKLESDFMQAYRDSLND